MIIIKVELHSAVTRRVTELARMSIVNDGTGTGRYGNYVGTIFRGRSTEQLNKQTIMRQKQLYNWPRLDFHVWNLVAKMHNELGYTKGK